MLAGCQCQVTCSASLFRTLHSVVTPQIPLFPTTFDGTDDNIAQHDLL